MATLAKANGQLQALSRGAETLVVFQGVEAERRAGIPGQEHLPPALLRLSVGIELVEDLWHDLDQPLRNLP